MRLPLWWPSLWRNGSAMSEARAAWKRIVEELKAGPAVLQDPSVRAVILESWHRSREAGVQPKGPVLLRSVDAVDLSRRLLQNKGLLEAAVEAIDEFSRSLVDIKH